jgi:hypothetical protein
LAQIIPGIDVANTLSGAMKIARLHTTEIEFLFIKWAELEEKMRNEPT